VHRRIALHTKRDNLAKQLAFQHQIAAHLSTGILLLDQQLLIQYANASAEALLERSWHKLLNTEFHEILPNTEINQERLHSVLSSGQEITDNEIVLKLISGKIITLEITASPVTLEQGSYVLLEIRQVDKQKQISAEAFQQQQWEAARDLIRGLAHEIKNPLGGIRGAAQLLKREISPLQQEFTDLIIEQTDRLKNLVDRLLGPNQLPQFSLQNIHFILEKIRQLCSLDNPKNIQFIRDYDPSIPDLAIDEDKMQQAILNIVNNAMQVLPEKGKITIKTRVCSNQTINGKLTKLCAQISLIDNGPGIPYELQDKLFYPMVSGRENGTGLGLSIAQILVNQHHGKLSCHSVPGRTEFIVLLPITQEDVA
jgi:two-component system nitrogen regulation sensor histidine kinase GlnL